MDGIKEILNVRNLIVANERSIASDTTGKKSREIVNNISPMILITNNNSGQKFLEDYIIPQIEHFQSFFQNASKLELDYFHSFYSFVTKEHYISKVGDTEYESTKGISSLWLSTLQEKIETGDILTDLSIAENLSEKELPKIRLNIPIPAFDQDFLPNSRHFLPNFRQGDIVILYERNNDEDSVTNKQIFKGTIEKISPKEVTIRLRFRQRNKKVFPQNSKYAIEHDFLDSSYNTMYRALYAFLQANQDRKDLLLNQRMPLQDTTLSLINNNDKISEEIKEIILKAKQAKDYFLLIGPPGTGKTSKALKSMVEEFYCEPNNNILLLSYTNRAVDEICNALDDVKGNPPYIRIGSELSCEEKYRKRLLKNIIGNCVKRDEVKAEIQKHRIFVGTVASLSAKTELFKLKHFQVAIIDEASQILEPSIIGILSAKDFNENNAIDKFILIGDHKQLPAIVLQKEKESKVTQPALRQIGLLDRRNSLFERLYNLHKDEKSSVLGILNKQGRMHPDIAQFPNDFFYNSQLEIIPVEHQEADLEYKIFDKKNLFQKLITSKRIVFIPSQKHMDDKSNKRNTYEARIVKELVIQIFNLFKINNLKFEVEKTIGVISPYRSQIALIKKEIHDLNEPELDNITVDTVERFQGSQRDIIIYSVSINNLYQLKFLANTIEEEGQIIDRKMNVAITRAKKQFFVTGNPLFLSRNYIYNLFIEFIRSKAGYINAMPDDFLKGSFQIEEPAVEKEISGKGDKHKDYNKEIMSISNISFQNIREVAYNSLLSSKAERDSLWKMLNRGAVLLDSHNLLCQYLFSYGFMHEAKIHTALKSIPKELFSEPVTIIDWGCGQGLATICFLDFLKQHSIQSHIQKIVLIEPSQIALDRAELHVSAYLKDDSKINIVNKYLDDVTQEDIEIDHPIILHFFSNILDIENIDLERLSQLISRNTTNKQYFICVSPLNPSDYRINQFEGYFKNTKILANNEYGQLPQKHGCCTAKILVFSTT
jgi:superfamily I DNA and/or RNA helicase